MTSYPRAESVASLDVYWRDVFLGTAFRFSGASNWIDARFVAGHGFDERFVELMDYLFDESLPPKDPPAHLEPLFAVEDGQWKLVGGNGRTWAIDLPAIDRAASTISFRYLGDDYPNLKFVDE